MGSFCCVKAVGTNAMPRRPKTVANTRPTLPVLFMKRFPLFHLLEKDRGRLLGLTALVGTKFPYSASRHLPAVFMERIKFRQWPPAFAPFWTASRNWLTVNPPFFWLGGY